MGFILPSPTSPVTQAQALMLKKSAIETEVQSQISILQTNNIDMTTPLVDAEGFPRADIDIYAVRKARVRIIELRNDLKDVMNEAGKVLEEVYAKTPEPDLGMESQEQGTQRDGLVPFARVDGVAPGSPAAEAGVQREDLILKFGNLVESSFNPPSSLTPLATLVSENEDVRPKTCLFCTD
jgi:26S proteasome non-ATPase regulatory subunit 9